MLVKRIRNRLMKRRKKTSGSQVLNKLRFRTAAMNRFMKDPFIQNEVMGIVEDAELMGVDFDEPEEMQGLIDVVKKIASAVKKRRAKKKASGESTAVPTFSMQTAQGTAQLGPSGLSWVGAPGVQQSLPIGTTGLQIAPVQQESFIDKIKSNPALLAGVVAVPVLLIVMSQRGKKNES